MNGFTHPKLRNRRTGAEIEVNVNPFSIGRGLSCNYILPNKTVSRIHCVLEKDDDGTWVLRDSSTNGTFVNGKLIKNVKSPPLKDNDVISMEIEGVDKYIFVTDQANDDISDEQLCAIADSVLNEMEYMTSNPLSGPESNQQAATSLSPNIPPSDMPITNHLLDHIYTVQANPTVKKARMARTPRPILGCGNRQNSDITPHVPPQPNTSRVDREPMEDHPEPVGRVETRLVSVPSDSSVATLSSTAESTRDGAGSAFSVGDNSDTLLSTPSSTSETWQSESTGKNEEILVGSSQTTDGSSTSTEGAACSVQPGPSTDKTENADHQPDHYEVMENELQCVICSELFVKALTLNCSHTFCKYCIGMWNKNKSDCPICRTKITSTTPTIVLDNVIEKVIENSNAEIKEHRRSLLEERRKQEEAENRPPARPQRRAARGQGRGRAGIARRARGARGNGAQEAQPRINVLDPVAINIGALVNNVIEVSSDSDWSSDTESMSPTDMHEDYDLDDWYNSRGNYWGGYGYCFRCGSPTHWANNCPNR